MYPERVRCAVNRIACMIGFPVLTACSTGVKFSSPGRIGSPAASAEVQPAGRSALDLRFQIAPEPAVDPCAEKRASHISYSVHESLLTMIACRSPPAFWPPSIRVSGPNGYGPLLLSLAYLNLMRTSGWALVAMV